MSCVQDHCVGVAGVKQSETSGWNRAIEKAHTRIDEQVRYYRNEVQGRKRAGDFTVMLNYDGTVDGLLLAQALINSLKQA